MRIRNISEPSSKGDRPVRYALWNNKGGVGKTFLSFILGTELAHRGNKPVILIDMCPQANLSEIVLGGNGQGIRNLEKLIDEQNTIGGYFDTRISSPHAPTGDEESYLIQAQQYNEHLPESLYLIAGDASLEIQAQVINQIGSQTLPVGSWDNVHSWLINLIDGCTESLGADETLVFIDCNPSFSAYTELSMLAADRLIVPCSSDGSSARAISNLGRLLYGIELNGRYGDANFFAKAEECKMLLPLIHSVILNRSTQYSQKASKAFGAMFDAIKDRVNQLRDAAEERFEDGEAKFADMPDSHTATVVCSHLGLPLYALEPKQYEVYGANPQVNAGPLERYQEAVAALLEIL